MAAQGFVHPELLAETDWLASHLDDPGIRIVDCEQYDVYGRAHIKNAVGVKVHHYIKHPGYASDTKAHPLVAPPEHFKELMESMGIGDDTLVVVYDNSRSLHATRLWWVLSYYGHTNVKVLNGGWPKWFDEGRPVTIDVPDPPRATITPRENPDLLCTLDYGVAHVNDPDTVLLDVRSDGEWDGTNDRGNKRAGHVPGAVHLEWMNFVTDDRHRTFRSAGELRAMLEERGVTPDKQIIAY